MVGETKMWIEIEQSNKVVLGVPQQEGRMGGGFKNN